MSQRAGELCHRIIIEKLSLESRDEDGNFLPSTWVEHKKLWAKVTWSSVKDVLTAKASNSETIARCKLRKRDDIDSSMRVLFGEQTFQIVSPPKPDNENGRIYMTLELSLVE